MTIQEHTPLASYTNYKIGGPARYFAEAQSVDEVRDGIQAARERNAELLVLAGGTNMLVPDEGIDKFVLRIEVGGITIHNATATAGAGATMHELVEMAIAHDLQGLEWAGGLPGSVGGAVRGNAGAFGGEIKDTLTRALAVTPDGELKEYTRDDCRFGYRESAFKHNRDVIVEASFALKPGDRAELMAIAESHRAFRRERHPMEYGNAGSTFKNVPVEQVPAEFLKTWEHKVKNDPFPVLPVAVIICALGLKGYRVGDAQVSEKHANYVVNLGHATAADVRAVIEHVKHEVQRQAGVALEEEILVL
ncbi:MAG: UDP-N-acetylmuramate dehydrogenase [Patescibacteria group bacterium]|jgi:UDP-N-acetylmuramate dehydrogenase